MENRNKYSVILKVETSVSHEIYIHCETNSKLYIWKQHLVLILHSAYKDPAQRKYIKTNFQIKEWNSMVKRKGEKGYKYLHI